MDTTQIILTAIIAATTIVYTIVTAYLLNATKKSIDLTRRALVLSALMKEAELVLEDSARNPDGTLRYGGEKSVPRMTLHEYGNKVINFRKEIEKLK
jgi:hypothetical protein